MLQGCRLSAARQRSAPLLPMQMCDAARPQPLGQSNFVLLRNTLAHTISKRPTICRMNLLRGKLRSNGPLMCADLIFRVSDIAKLLAKTNFPQQAKYIHFSKLVRESGPWTGDTLLLKHTPLVRFLFSENSGGSFCARRNYASLEFWGSPQSWQLVSRDEAPLSHSVVFPLLSGERKRGPGNVCQRNCWGLMLVVPRARAGGRAGNLLSRRLLSSCTASHNSSKVNPCRRRVARVNRNTGCLTPQAAQRRRRALHAGKGALQLFSLWLCVRAAPYLHAARRHVCRKALFAQAEKNFQHSRQYWFSIKRRQCIQLKGRALFVHARAQPAF